MSVGLIVERRDAKGITSPISVAEWKALVESHSDLRMRTNPYVGVVPGSGKKITIPIGEADSEIQVQDQWLPFLRFRRGALVTEYQREFEEPNNPERRKIATVAKQLIAVIAMDDGDGLLVW